MSKVAVPRVLHVEFGCTMAFGITDATTLTQFAASFARAGSVNARSAVHMDPYSSGEFRREAAEWLL
ncbi:hypothetical protein E1281_35125 [Actinomadura sp. KC345]|uniref:hypothetical protein n=1 Tax=Actinomadura sp. KC345 TaxID=2530371 RepID=UPI00104D40D3|nr:hypothetical protein [Actinomadura sp. KC345]TDC43532.1 hypothetical protein E1281_35125 [Actinomadura sp. KC345]